MRKFLAVLMIAIAAFFLFVVAKGAIQLPRTQRKLKSAVFVEDGRVHPENEGKLVIVLGQLGCEEGARDEIMGLTFPSPCVRRWVESFHKQYKDGQYVMNWEPVSESSDVRLKNAPLLGTATLGEFTIAGDLLLGFPAGKDVSLSMLDEGEVDALEEHAYIVESLGVVYFSEAPSSSFGSDLDAYSYDDYEGDRRVHYRLQDMSSPGVFAVAGIQRGSSLQRDETLGSASVYENARTKDEVIRQNGGFTLLGMILVTLVCAALIFFGVRRLRY